MPTNRRRPAAALLALVLGVSLAACSTTTLPGPTGTDGPVTPPATTAGPATASPGPASPSAAPELTPVPGGATGSPDDPDRPSTTVTEWGTILDRVPEGFPVYPGALTAESLDEPASGAWFASDDPGSVADWYVATFEELGWSSVDLGSPLEGGTRVLDLASDLPECRVRTTFRPAGESTMIIVLYGAGCAGGDG